MGKNLRISRWLPAAAVILAAITLPTRFSTRLEQHDISRLAYPGGPRVKTIVCGSTSHMLVHSPDRIAGVLAFAWVAALFGAIHPFSRRSLGKVAATGPASTPWKCSAPSASRA